MVYITGDVHGDIRRFGAPARRLKKGDIEGGIFVIWNDPPYDKIL